MATLSQLVDVVAAVEGIDPERVTAIARAVREAGLVTTGGRGPSAAQMTERDAANLLIAVNTADIARNAPEIVGRYRALESRKKKRTVDFGNHFEQAILAARNSDIPEFILNSVRDFGSSRNFLGRRALPLDHYRLRIEFEKPEPSVLIQIETFAPFFSMNHISFRGAQRARNKSDQGDRKERTVISHRTLIEVGQALI